MAQPINLQGIVGDSGEDGYEVPHSLVGENKRYLNLPFNTGDGSATQHTRCCKNVSDVRQLQILCAVLLASVIGSSITIGVVIYKLDSRISVNEQKTEANTQTLSSKVNGSWSSWSTWSSCTKTCNTGQKERNRSCSNPAHVEMGRSCIGNTHEMTNCNEIPCPDPMSAFAIYGYYPTYNSSSEVAVFFSGTRMNIGNHYNTVTGQYICYYPGVYVFSLNLYKVSGASRVNCYIRKNGSGYAIADVPSESQSGYYESSASTIFHLNRGDTVDVGGCSNPDGIDNYTSFIGFLLKAD